LNSTQQLSTIKTTSKRKKKDLSTIEHKKDHNMLQMQELAWEKHEMWWVKPAGLGKSTRCGGLKQLAWEKHEMWLVKPAGLGKAQDVVG
jgi:hypothetical protein